MTPLDLGRAVVGARWQTLPPDAAFFVGVDHGSRRCDFSAAQLWAIDATGRRYLVKHSHRQRRFSRRGLRRMLMRWEIRPSRHFTDETYKVLPSRSLLEALTSRDKDAT